MNKESRYLLASALGAGLLLAGCASEPARYEGDTVTSNNGRTVVRVDEFRSGSIQAARMDRDMLNRYDDNNDGVIDSAEFARMEAEVDYLSPDYPAPRY
jgi:hypothetical protein